MAAANATLRVLNTTWQHWVKGMSDETIEMHPILAALREKSQIDYSASGTRYEETIKYRRLSLGGYQDLQRLQWARNNLHKKMEVEWRGLQMADAISEKEMRQNRGMEARVKLFTDKLDKMKSDADDDIGKFFYYDGAAAAHNTKLHGIQSFMSQTSPTATDAFATTLNDTYAGLATARGNYGGTVKGGGSPSGTNFESDDPEWDFWSPVLVNATYNDGSVVRSWANDAEELLGRAIVHAMRGSNRSHMLDLFTVQRQNFVLLKEAIRSKERIVVDPGERSLMVKLGFKNVIQVDGVDVIIDPDMPSTTVDGSTSLYAYGWNFKQMKLCLLPGDKSEQKGFWNDSGMEFEATDKTYRFWLGLWGNFVFKPRHFVEIAAYA